MVSNLDTFSQMINVRKLSNEYVGPYTPTFIYEDHRTAVLAIWAALQDGIFPKPPLLVRFDAHKDFARTRPDWLLVKSSIKDFDSALVATNSLRADDGDWVTAVLELGLVSNVLTFFIEDHEREFEPYTDHTREEHSLVWLGRLSKQFGKHHGVFDDVSMEEEFGPIREAIGWKSGKGWDNDYPVWFDIDFDFAMHNLPNEFGSIPWCMTDFENEFHKPVNTYGPYHNAGEFVRSVIQRSNLITFASEPAFCENIEGVYQIGVCIQAILRDLSFEYKLVSNRDIQI